MTEPRVRLASWICQRCEISFPSTVAEAEQVRRDPSCVGERVSYSLSEAREWDRRHICRDLQELGSWSSFADLPRMLVEWVPA